jgi:transposase InsO family protein
LWVNIPATFSKSAIPTAILTPMVRLVCFLLALLGTTFRTRRSLQIEVAALRHQLLLYQASGKRPHITSADRLLWSIVARAWNEWRNALLFVQPRTVVRWQQRRFRDYWRRLSDSSRIGRPPISPELRALITQMWTANPTWGLSRIVGELRKLGIDVAKSTVEKYRPRTTGSHSPTWRTFLDSHLKDLVSVDFFIVPTVSFKVLFVFLVLSHDRRRVVHFNVTQHPTAQWSAQQLNEAFPFDTAPRYLLRDRGGIYGEVFRRRAKSLDIDEILTAPRSPWQIPYVERLIGSIRRECLDHVVILNERHLKRLLSDYFDYYHRWRTHRSLDMDAPARRRVHSAQPAQVIEFPAVDGLHHYYLPKAA